MDAYKIEPKYHKNDIPVFSERNEYIDNYEKISEDHIECFMKTGKNPFIDEESWIESEKYTAGLIAKHSQSNQKVLDVGVGMGRLLSNFPNLERYGMDISFGYLNIAKDKGINVSFSQIEDMPYSEKYFDIIVCTDVLEHVIDLHLCICNILSTLKQDGIIVIRVPYRESLKGYLSKDFPYKYCHLRSFDEDSIRIIFEKVYNCELIEFEKSSFNLKYWISKYLKVGRKKFWKFCLKYKILKYKFCYPVEINFVFKKRTDNQQEG